MREWMRRFLWGVWFDARCNRSYLLALWQKRVIRTVGAGDWWDPENWDRGRVPEDNDYVVVRHEMHTIDRAITIGCVMECK